MLKPYTRQQIQTNKIVDNCMYCTKPLLYTILKDKDTLYSIEEIQVSSKDRYLLREVTGVDNVCIIVYYDEDSTNIHFIDEKHGYSVVDNVKLCRHLVGLYDYVLTFKDRGYIIKTNYESVKELRTKFDIKCKRKKHA